MGGFYEFLWEDIITGLIRRREKQYADVPIVEFDLSQLAPTENLVIRIFDDDNHLMGQILLRR